MTIEEMILACCQARQDLPRAQYVLWISPETGEWGLRHGEVAVPWLEEVVDLTDPIGDDDDSHFENALGLLRDGGEGQPWGGNQDDFDRWLSKATPDGFTYGMTLGHIRKLADLGMPVYWKTRSYEVVKDSLGQYLIRCSLNEDCIGLGNGATLNGEPHEFFVEFPE